MHLSVSDSAPALGDSAFTLPTMADSCTDGSLYRIKTTTTVVILQDGGPNMLSGPVWLLENDIFKPIIGIEHICKRCLGLADPTANRQNNALDNIFNF